MDIKYHSYTIQTERHNYYYSLIIETCNGCHIFLTSIAQWEVNNERN